jgi:glycine/D-amino acid oxidase-like deaminating enzyme
MESVLSLFNRVGGRRVCFEFVLQACMRPCPPDGLPLLGPLPRTANAFIAAGHNCWGILWAPATGLAMSELLLDGAATSLSLDAFDPARFAMDGDGRSGKRTKTGREHVF